MTTSVHKTQAVFKCYKNPAAMCLNLRLLSQSKCF